MLPQYFRTKYLHRGTIMFLRDLKDSKTWSSENTKIHADPKFFKNMQYLIKKMFDSVGSINVWRLSTNSRFIKIPPSYSSVFYLQRSETPIVLDPSERKTQTFKNKFQKYRCPLLSRKLNCWMFPNVEICRIIF